MHDALARYATAHINVAVIGIAAERESSSLQLPVQIRQQDVGQQRRERSPLWGALSTRLDQPLLHHPGFQEPTDELEHACITDLPCHPRHQHIVVDPIEELLQIKIHHPALTFTDVRLRPAHRLLRAPPRTKAIARIRERRLKKRLQDLMQCLLDQPIYHRGYSKCAYPARGLGDIHSTYCTRQVAASKQCLLHAWPVHLEPALKLGHRELIDPRSAFVLDHSLVRQPQVAAFDHPLHQVILRFRSPGCRRADLGTQAARYGLPARLRRLGLPHESFCFFSPLRDHPSYSRSRRSALRCPHLLWPRLTSECASEDLPIPVAQRHALRSPRVLRTLIHAYARRIYVIAFRTRTGLRSPLPAHPAVPPLSASCSSRQRFASGFLQTPSRLGRPCRSANTSPCRVCRGLPPPRECTLPGAHRVGGE